MDDKRHVEKTALNENMGKYAESDKSAGTDKVVGANNIAGTGVKAISEKNAGAGKVAGTDKIVGTDVKAIIDKGVKKEKGKGTKRFSLGKLGENKYFNILLSLILASLAWVLINTYTNPPNNKTIQKEIVIRNMEYLSENDLLLVDEDSLKGSVEVTVQGRQEDIEKLGVLNFNAFVDLSNIGSAEDRELQVDLELLNVSNNVKVSYWPDKIAIKLENEITVSIPVTNNIVNGEVKEGYTLTGIELYQYEFSFTALCR